jgi:hypothetical protein
MIEPSPKLKLPTTAETALFRMLERTLVSDATLDRVVKTWRAFHGRPDDKADMTEAQCPWVRLSLQPTGLSFYTPSSMEGQLDVIVELAVSGTCLDDLHNLYGAILRAVYPTDAAARLTMQNRFRSAGARTGQWLPSQLAYDPTPGLEGILMGRGTMRITYRFDTIANAPTC